MENEASIKDIIIENAIELIAEGGFEMATTKRLTFHRDDLLDFKMNEVYIYRLFGSKEKVFESAFSRLEKELFNVFQGIIKEMQVEEASVKEVLYDFFIKAWNFILGAEVRLRSYVRYYYSIYFKGDSFAAHSKHFDEIASAFNPFFKDEADVKAIMKTVFILLLDFAVRVCNGEVENNEDNVWHIFNVLYNVMAIYFKE